MLETIRRCGSRVEVSAITEKTTSPWLRYLRPSSRGTTLQRGGKMELTRTRFWLAMPASRRASSKEVRRSLCLPTPLVKNNFFGTTLFPNFYVPSVRLVKSLEFVSVPIEFKSIQRAKTGTLRIHAGFICEPESRPARQVQARSPTPQ